MGITKNKRYTMNVNTKTYVIGGDIKYANWTESRIVYDIQDSDLVIVTGGEDVNPARYGEGVHPLTCFNDTRDGLEFAEIDKAILLGKKLLGVCRGSQALCVAAGGKLVQHQNNPAFLHPMETRDGETIIVSSTHHQAQWPWGLPNGHAELIGWSVGASEFHEGADGEAMDINGYEVEVVHYPKIKALAIQPHPEMLYGEPGHDRTIAWFQKLLRDFMEDKL